MKGIRPIANLEIEEAIGNHSGDLGNGVLYDLCSKHSFHKTDQEIIAKVWLIGRSYAAAIERNRKRSSDLSGDLFYEKVVAPKIKSSGIDDWLALLKNEPTPKNAIEVHWELLGCFHKISEHHNRSLASKYLHFHFKNLFFIYDSRAMSAIRAVTPSSEKQLGKFSLENFALKKFDPEYSKFFCRCLWLQDNLQKQYGGVLSPRNLDKILLYVTDSRKN